MAEAKLLPKVLFLVATGRLILPFFRHEFVALPVLLTVLGIVVNGLWVALLLSLGDPTVEVFRITSQAAFRQRNSTNRSDTSGTARYTFPVHRELFCRSVVTQATIYAAALLCLTVWLFVNLERAYLLYLLPMIRDLQLIRTRQWAQLDDWSALDVGEQEKHL